MKETKTIQVYPDDNLVNTTIEEYASFGWEVINNQRCQEYDRQTYGANGSVTNHYSTFNKITFTREKSSPWYEEVTQLEKEHAELQNTIEKYKAKKPVLMPPKRSGTGDIVLCVFLYLLYIIPGVIFTIVICCANSKYKKYMKQYDKETAEYNAVYPAKIKDLENKKADLRTRAEKRILGKA